MDPYAHFVTVVYGKHYEGWIELRTVIMNHL